MSRRRGRLWSRRELVDYWHSWGKQLTLELLMACHLLSRERMIGLLLGRRFRWNSSTPSKLPKIRLNQTGAEATEWWKCRFRREMSCGPNGTGHSWAVQVCRWVGKGHFCRWIRFRLCKLEDTRPVIWPRALCPDRSWARRSGPPYWGEVLTWHSHKFVVLGKCLPLQRKGQHVLRTSFTAWVIDWVSSQRVPARGEKSEIAQRGK